MAFKFISTRGAFGALCMVAAQPAFPFAGVGFLGECPSFTTCTAGVSSSARYVVQRDVSATPGYPLGSLGQGLTQFQDEASTLDSATVSVSNLPPPPPPAVVTVPWAVFGSAKAQSDIRDLHAQAYSSRAVAGTHQIGQQSAAISQLTLAESTAAWRDVWDFSAPGSFSARVSADGGSSLAGVGVYPSGFTFTPRATLADWYFRVRVWDVDNQSISDDYELGGPTPVAQVYLRGFGEQRKSIDDSGLLEFNFVPGVQYVVTGELSISVRNGSEVDLFNTGHLGNATLSNGATLTALSGHDYLAPVPEPSSWLLFAGGLVAITRIGRWHRRQA
jgi:hypothetical protein